MSVLQFVNFCFDPKDIVAIDTNPEGYEKEADDHYLVYIKDVGPILLTGEAGRKCLALFLARR